MQAPCKDCPDRHTLCHSTCEKYIAFNKYREEVRAKKREFYEKEYGILDTRRKGRRKP